MKQFGYQIERVAVTRRRLSQKDQLCEEYFNSKFYRTENKNDDDPYITDDSRHIHSLWSSPKQKQTTHAISPGTKPSPK